MDMILICRDALEDSVIGNVAVALEAKKAGQDVGILFTQEALAALAGEAFGWSPLFRNRAARIKILANATAMGLEVADVKEKRSTDLFRLLKSVKELGISLMACPIWSKLLNVDGKLPQEITPIDASTMFKILQETRIIIGGF